MVAHRISNPGGGPPRRAGSIPVARSKFPAQSRLGSPASAEINTGFPEQFKGGQPVATRSTQRCPCPPRHMHANPTRGQRVPTKPARRPSCVTDVGCNALLFSRFNFKKAKSKRGTTRCTLLSVIATRPVAVNRDWESRACKHRWFSKRWGNERWGTCVEIRGWKPRHTSAQQKH